MYFCPECDYQSDEMGRCPQCNLSLVSDEDNSSDDDESLDSYGFHEENGAGGSDEVNDTDSY